MSSVCHWSKNMEMFADADYKRINQIQKSDYAQCTPGKDCSILKQYVLATNKAGILWRVNVKTLEKSSAPQDRLMAEAELENEKTRCVTIGLMCCKLSCCRLLLSLPIAICMCRASSMADFT